MINKRQVTDNIIQYQFSYMRENIFYLKNQEILIDTGSPNAKSELKEIIKQINITKIIITHSHFDHIGNIDIFKNTPIIMSKTSKEIVTKNKDEYMLFNWIGSEVVEVSTDQISTKFKHKQLQIINTPGHLTGSIVIYDKNNKFLFTGDLIFGPTSIGRTDIPGSDKNEMKQSLQKLLELEIHAILPGHGEICYEKNIVSKALKIL
ncbi:MBL fold metallo-hydrolase [Candidatus Dojkabacteria bacterium]|nr:MBL fold metallo-hydrolase [Candidatus Dojkabacteria bacterium]